MKGENKAATNINFLNAIADELRDEVKEPPHRFDYDALVEINELIESGAGGGGDVYIDETNMAIYISTLEETRNFVG